MIPALIFAAGAGFLVLLLWQRYLRLARERYIRQFALPRGLYERLRKRRPELELKDCALVARGLRQFFLAYLNSGCRFVAMPSQAVDDLWHEFILYTRAYEAFCGKAFGGFLHHTPAVVLSPDKRNNEGLRRVWWQCCKEENIDPRSPLRLPLLFAIDAKSASPTVSSTSRIARRCRAAKRAPPTAARISATARSTAAPMVSPMAARMAVATAAVAAAAAVAAVTRT